MNQVPCLKEDAQCFRFRGLAWHVLSAVDMTPEKGKTEVWAVRIYCKHHNIVFDKKAAGATSSMLSPILRALLPRIRSGSGEDIA